MTRSGLWSPACLALLSSFVPFGRLLENAMKIVQENRTDFRTKKREIRKSEITRQFHKLPYAIILTFHRAVLAHVFIHVRPLLLSLPLVAWLTFCGCVERVFVVHRTSGVVVLVPRWRGPVYGLLLAWPCFRLSVGCWKMQWKLCYPRFSAFWIDYLSVCFIHYATLLQLFITTAEFQYMRTLVRNSAK